MNQAPERYVLDANTFIQAKRRFYGFDFCPGYWQSLIWHQQQERLVSIDRVYVEIEHGGDDLYDWVRQHFGRASFADTTSVEVTTAYSQMLTWVMAQPQFLDQAKDDFQRVADGWLAAYAKAKGCVLVTLEEYDPVVRKKVPLPNVCKAFDVETISPFEMLRRLNVLLSWKPHS